MNISYAGLVGYYMATYSLHGMSDNWPYVVNTKSLGTSSLGRYNLINLRKNYVKGSVCPTICSSKSIIGPNNMLSNGAEKCSLLLGNQQLYHAFSDVIQLQFWRPSWWRGCSLSGSLNFFSSSFFFKWITSNSTRKSQVSSASKWKYLKSPWKKGI